MPLPPPDPFSVPESEEQAMSDFLFHCAVSAGSYAAVYAYTGLYAGPGHAGILWHAFFSTARVGSTVGGLTGVVALEETAFAMSVYAEPFVAFARFVAPVVVPLVAATVFHHTVTSASRSLGLYEADMSPGAAKRDLEGLGIGYDNL